MAKALVAYFAEPTAEEEKQVNILPGWVEPARHARDQVPGAPDGREGRSCSPTPRDVLDAPQTGKHEFYPKGGATVEQIRGAGDSIGTIGLGLVGLRSARQSAGRKVRGAVPDAGAAIGLQATDRFIEALRTIAGAKVPDIITDERGRLLDMIADMHQYLYGKRVALFGDPDQLVSLTEFLVCLDMRPVYIVTGTPSTRFEKRIGRRSAAPCRRRRYARARRPTCT